MKIKKSLILVCVSFILSSCLNEMNVGMMEQVESKEEAIVLEYVPNGNVETLTLNNGLTVYMDEDSTYFLEDITFSKEQISLMNASSSRSAVLYDMVKYWSTRIPYQILPGFSDTEIQYIKDAMSDISAVSPITFYESSLSSQRINFTPNANSNSSPVGMQQGGNRVLLANGGFIKGSAIHEIMHSLGIFHEQSRSDRDSYLIINWNNIAAGKEHNFDKYSINYKGIDVGTFDFNSIMLYSSTAFSKNNEPTMLKKSDGGMFYANESNLSVGDIAGINCFYGPTMGIESTVTGGYDESGNDYIDRRTDYSNEVYFYSATGEQITLEYPRLIVVKCINGTRSSSSQPMNESVSRLYFLAPAGSSSYSLPNTSDYYQSDMGYIRWEEYTRYYIEN